MVLLLLSAAVPAVQAAEGPAPSMAFYYGRDVPVDLLTHFDRVVVEADEMDRASLQTLQQARTEVFAYVSLGEINRTRPLYHSVDRRWMLGPSASYQSDILDLTQTGWRTLLIEQWVRPLSELGYQGLFLDTLDSYQSLVKDAAGRERQVAALCAIIRAIRERFPALKLIFNRGFEVLPRVGGLAAGLVAESLFQGYDPVSGGYTELPEEGRSWLLQRLIEARDTYHLPVTVIDYVPTPRRDLMRATARRIAQLGFTPWVSSAGLDVLGVGAVEVVPRRVLALYNGAEQTDPHQVPDVAYTEVHRMGAMPLEYQGYAVDYADLRAPLPAYSLAGRYAGVVTWFSQAIKNPAPTAAFCNGCCATACPWRCWARSASNCRATGSGVWAYRCPRPTRAARSRWSAPTTWSASRARCGPS